MPGMDAITSKANMSEDPADAEEYIDPAHNFVLQASGYTILFESTGTC